MVRPHSSRPSRRNRHAGAQRQPPPEPEDAGAKAPPAGPVDPIRFPNLAAQLEMERQQLMREARAQGLTREQASRHADEHLRGRGERKTP